MLNQAVLIGRLVREPELKKTDNGNSVSNITLAVNRAYKNINGEYDADFISCVLWKGVAESTVSYCKKGDLVGVKGHIQTRSVDSEEGKRSYVEVVAEKVTFLSSRKTDKEK